MSGDATARPGYDWRTAGPACGHEGMLEYLGSKYVAVTW